MKLKELFVTVVLLALALPVTAQHKTTLYDSTSVVMEESGLSHVINHQRIRANDLEGCRSRRAQCRRNDRAWAAHICRLHCHPARRM